MSFLDDDWRPFNELSDEEKIASGHVQVSPGVWKKRAGDPAGDGELTPLIREFDSGVVADLHDPKSQAAWEKMGKRYIEGVGPVIGSNSDLKDFCEIAGVRPKGMSEIRYEKQQGLWGYEMSRPKKVRVQGPVEDLWDRFRRDHNEVVHDMKHHQTTTAIEERAKNSVPRRSGKFYSVP